MNRDLPGAPRWADNASLIMLVCGVLLLLYGLVDREPSSEPAPEASSGGEAIAHVNGVAIPRSALSANTRTADRASGVQQLIDEELLVQQASALGLLRSDPLVRRRAVELISRLASATTVAPAEQALRSHYDAHRNEFQKEAKLEVAQLFFRTREAADRAFSQLQKSGWKEVAKSAERAPLGEYGGALALSKLRQYFGDAIAEKLAAAQPHAVLGPLRSSMGHHIFRVVSKQPGGALTFSAARPAVVESYTRMAAAKQFSEYLAQLRDAAEVEVHADN